MARQIKIIDDNGETRELPLHLRELLDANIPEEPQEGSFLSYQDGTWTPVTMNASGSCCYLLELLRWNVSNEIIDYSDKTLAVNNSNGINDALVWAAGQGYAEVLLPKGSYLIDETIPVKVPSYVTFNLNGSKLRVRDNNLENYEIVKFEDVQFSRVTNGLIEGDRDAHDYSSGGTHEFGVGVSVQASKFISIDNLEIYNVTGDGIYTGNQGGNLSYYLRKATSEQGTYDLATGLPKEDNTRIRWTNQLDVTHPLLANNGYFTLAGNGFGSLGSGITAGVASCQHFGW